MQSEANQPYPSPPNLDRVHQPPRKVQSPPPFEQKLGAIIEHIAAARTTRVYRYYLKSDKSTPRSWPRRAGAHQQRRPAMISCAGWRDERRRRRSPPAAGRSPLFGVPSSSKSCLEVRWGERAGFTYMSVLGEESDRCFVYELGVWSTPRVTECTRVQVIRPIFGVIRRSVDVGMGWK